MREIKFKAWDKLTEKMFDVHAISQTAVEERKNGVGYVYDRKDIILMQYTGIKDKNGVEICEGDIVRHVSVGSKSTYTVTFDQSSAAFYYKPNVVEGATGYSMFVNEKGFAPYIVIGNCYENPDSL